ncbi:hypothetical protein [Nocardioides montaniterrae]
MSDAAPTFPPRLDQPTDTDVVELPEVDPASPVVEMPVRLPVSSAQTVHAGNEGMGPRPTEAPEGVEISYEQFGRYWIRRVLHLERILETVDSILGPTIELGPIGAGPGRAFASVTVVGRFSKTTGHEVHADLLTYDLKLPIAVTFTLDLPMDSLTFNADVVVPLKLVVHTHAPARIRLDLTMSTEKVDLVIQPSTRRGAVFQRITGLESELRRFLPQVLQTELTKPYIQKALNLDVEKLIENSWADLSRQFLPQGPEDRKV